MCAKEENRIKKVNENLRTRWLTGKTHTIKEES